MPHQLSSVEAYLEQSVVASSRGRAWPGIEVMSARIAHAGLDVDGLSSHTLALNIGRPFRVEGRVDGRAADGAMPTGAMKLVAAGGRSTWRWDAGAPIDILHLSLADDALASYAAELDVAARPEIATRVGIHDSDLARIGKALAGELRSPRMQSLVSDALRIELVTRVLAQYSSLAGSSALRLSANRMGVRTLRLLDDYIDEHLGNDVTIGDLATLAAMSRFHFARVFRTTTGSTPHHYVLERRLERARELLQQNGLALRDVAAATGFADQSHLTRHIKRRYGVTPGVLRAS